MALEGGQTFEIPIDSPLEANMEDAIVSASQPTFAYNPQAPVSGLLTNSIKYEGDGVFSDWYRYRYSVLFNHHISFSDEFINLHRPDFAVAITSGRLRNEFPDVGRSFWDWRGEKYALEMAFPWTRYLRNLSFACGFGDILPGVANGVITAESNAITPSVNRTVDTETEDGRYIVQGGTFRDNRRFRFSLHPYDRELDPYGLDMYDQGFGYDEEGNVTVDFIPDGYEVDAFFGLETIHLNVVHQTSDEDRMTLALPMVMRNETFAELNLTRFHTVAGWVDPQQNFTNFIFDERGERHMIVRETLIPGGPMMPPTAGISVDRASLDTLDLHFINGSFRSFMFDGHLPTSSANTVAEEVYVDVRNRRWADRDAKDTVDFEVGIKRAITQVEENSYVLGITPDTFEMARERGFPRPTVRILSQQAGRPDWPTPGHQVFVKGLLDISGIHEGSFAFFAFAQDESYAIVASQNRGREQNALVIPWRRTADGAVTTREVFDVGIADALSPDFMHDFHWADSQGGAPQGYDDVYKPRPSRITMQNDTADSETFKQTPPERTFSVRANMGYDFRFTTKQPGVSEEMAFRFNNPSGILSFLDTDSVYNQNFIRPSRIDDIRWVFNNNVFLPITIWDMDANNGQGAQTNRNFVDMRFEWRDNQMPGPGGVVITRELWGTKIFGLRNHGTVQSPRFTAYFKMHWYGTLIADPITGRITFNTIPRNNMRGDYTGSINDGNRNCNPDLQTVLNSTAAYSSPNHPLARAYPQINYSIADPGFETANNGWRRMTVTGQNVFDRTPDGRIEDRLGRITVDFFFGFGRFQEVTEQTAPGANSNIFMYALPVQGTTRPAVGVGNNRPPPGFATVHDLSTNPPGNTILGMFNILRDIQICEFNFDFKFPDMIRVVAPGSGVPFSFTPLPAPQFVRTPDNLFTVTPITDAAITNVFPGAQYNDPDSGRQGFRIRSFKVGKFLMVRNEFELRARDVEFGDWELIVTDESAISSFVLYKRLEMYNTNDEGLISLQFGQVSQPQDPLGMGIGITFKFRGRWASYIDRLVWRDTAQDTTMIALGQNERVAARVAFQEWSFLSTLRSGNDPANLHRQWVDVEFEGLTPDERMARRFFVNAEDLTGLRHAVINRNHAGTVGQWEDEASTFVGLLMGNVTIDRRASFNTPGPEPIGTWRLHDIQDITVRRIVLRRMLQLFRNGMVEDKRLLEAGTPIVGDPISNFTARMGMRSTPAENIFVSYNNGIFDSRYAQDTPVALQKLELSFATEYVRHEGEEPMGSAERYWWDILQGDLPEDERLHAEEMYRRVFDSNPFNLSMHGNVYRLLFRDADKAEITFLPIGNFNRGVEDIKYLGHRPVTTTDPASQQITEHVQVDFLYKFRPDRHPHDQQWRRGQVTVARPGEANIMCEAFDLRRPNDNPKFLQLATPEDDYAILTTQFDNSTDTENFWYVDEDHIVQLDGDIIRMLRREEDGERSPKDGGYWGEVARVHRYELLGEITEGWRYGVSCSVEELPCLWIIKPHPVGIVIEYAQFRINAETNTTDFRSYLALSQGRFHVTNPIAFGDLRVIGFSNRAQVRGTRYDALAFMSAQPEPSQFLNTVRLSSTFSRGELLIGFVFDKGVHQWTVSLRGSIARIFNGFGNVGIDGTVTGGCVPMWAMNQQRGLSVSLRDKPTPEVSFQVTRRAFISGNSLCFVDDTYNNQGMCVYAKHTGNGAYRLRELPVRFARRRVSNKSYGRGADTRIYADFIPPNIVAVFMATMWAWARCASGAAMNYWATSNLVEDDPFYEDTQEFDEPVMAGQVERILFKVALALSSMAVNIVNNKINELSETIDGFLTQRGYYGRTAREAFKQAEEARERRLEAMSAEDRANAEAQEALAKTQKYQDAVLDGIIDGLNRMKNATSYPSAMAIAKARLGMGGIYSISADQNVFAGPGFTQVHLVQGARISGSFSYSHAAQGAGSMLCPRIPPIPIPFIGPLDINNTNLVGVTQVDGPNSAKTEVKYQPNVNVGSKHLVYSYPIRDVVGDHVIRQTLMTPVLEEEMQELYKADWRTREYPTMLLRFRRWNETMPVPADNCSIVQGTDVLWDNDETMEVPVSVDSGYPTFPDQGIFDYCVYPEAELYYTAIGGHVTGVSVRDTLVMDGQPSNVIIKNGMPLLASPYCCIEITGEISARTLFPRVFSGDSVLFNTTGANIVKGLSVFHGFDGYTNRIKKLTGDVGPDSETQHSIYSHVRQGAFKVASIPPPVSYFGKFSSFPALDTYRHNVDIFARFLRNLDTSTENLMGFRYALPIVHKNISLLPAAVQVIAPYKTHVVDGMTSLTTDIRTTDAINKRPVAHDFTIYGQAYRVNAEYISKINAMMGVLDIKDVVATLGLIYLGSTPKVAWFYAPITHTFFTFTGADTVEKGATAFRFREVTGGTWDFVSQEVAFRAFIDRGFKPEERIFGDIVRVNEDFIGLVYPPNETIVGRYGRDQDDREIIDFKYHGLASGLVVQGPRRGQANRFVLQELMVRDIIRHNRRDFWHGIRGDEASDFWTERKYLGHSDREEGIMGYYVEPFKLATAFLGLDEGSECLFEWEITFALTDLMKKIIDDKYVTVNLASELQTVGGMMTSEVTKLYLTKDLFKRNMPGTGYYSFRFNGRNGMGNSERLYIWSDGLVSIRQLKLHIAEHSSERTAPLVTRMDVTGLEEM